jgi:oligopeptide/dipeptide ABC transporter ATP-binding protein
LSDDLVIIDDVGKRFAAGGPPWRRRHVTAVEAVSLRIRRGETVGLVGESGSGKSTLGRMITGLVRPGSGHIIIDGDDVAALRGNRLRAMRRHVQMIFQDPYASLNPRMTVRDIVAEPLRNFGIATGARADELVRAALTRCGLGAQALDRYPRAFSGGQRQRIGIARALVLRPLFIVADEPVSALDVSIQAQIVNLLQDLQAEEGLTFLFISHDLSVVRHVADRIAVMYRGRLVELAPAERLFTAAQHPYTRLLIASIPLPDPVLEAARAVPEILVDRTDRMPPDSGCPFHPRCPHAQFPLCGAETPKLQERAAADSDGSHLVACHFPQTEA